MLEVNSVLQDLALVVAGIDDEQPIVDALVNSNTTLTGLDLRSNDFVGEYQPSRSITKGSVHTRSAHSAIAEGKHDVEAYGTEWTTEASSTVNNEAPSDRSLDDSFEACPLTAICTTNTSHASNL